MSKYWSNSSQPDFRALLVAEKQSEIARARFCTRIGSKAGQTAPHPIGSCRGLPWNSPLRTPNDCLAQHPKSRIALKSIGEGASSLFGGRPGSPEHVLCSRATPHLHRWNLGVAPEQEAFSGLLGLPPKGLLASSPIDSGAILELGIVPGNQGRKFADTKTDHAHEFPWPSLQLHPTSTC